MDLGHLIMIVIPIGAATAALAYSFMSEEPKRLPILLLAAFERRGRSAKAPAPAPTSAS